jgi:hypothetical protein
MNHPLVPPPIVINLTPPTSFLYRPLILCVNVGPQPYTFPNPFDLPQLGTFPLSILLAPIVALYQTPQLTPIPQRIHYFHLKYLAPLVGGNLPVEG